MNECSVRGFVSVWFFSGAVLSRLIDGQLSDSEKRTQVRNQNKAHVSPNLLLLIESNAGMSSIYFSNQISNSQYLSNLGVDTLEHSWRSE